METLSLIQFYWLALLWLVWFLLLFGGFFLGRPQTGETRRMPLWTRIGSSIILVVAGWSWYFFTAGQAAASFALLIALGMSLGLLGDLFMAKLTPLKQYLVGGMVAFGLGHIVYITACLQLAAQAGLNDASIRWASWLLWLFLGAIGWYLAVYRGQQPRPLHWLGLPYALLLASTAGVALGLALQESGFIPLAWGGALFLLSDLLIAARHFRAVRFALMDDLIWLTYGPAQMLIVFSVAAARSVLELG